MSKNKRQFCSTFRRILVKSPGSDFLQSDQNSYRIHYNIIQCNITNSINVACITHTTYLQSTNTNATQYGESKHSLNTNTAVHIVTVCTKLWRTLKYNEYTYGDLLLLLLLLFILSHLPVGQNLFCTALFFSHTTQHAEQEIFLTYIQLLPCGTHQSYHSIYHVIF